MESITEKLKKLQIGKSFPNNQDEQKFQSAIKEFNSLVLDGIARERGYSIQTIDEINYSYTINN